MGHTTIIELNHDLASEIRDNPGAFVDAVLQQLARGHVNFIPGGEIVASFHRHDQPIDKAWHRWKTKWTRSPP